MIRLFSKPYTCDAGVSVSSSGGNDIYPVGEAVDNDKSSYWENDGATPSYIINLGTARTIDCLYMKSDQIIDYKLYHSANGIAWTEVADGTNTEAETGIWHWFDFTEQTKQYWKIEVTTKDAGNVKIYEVMLFEAKLTITDDVALVRHIDRIGVNYIMANGAAQTAAGLRLYADITYKAQLITKTERDTLYTLFTTPSPRYPLSVYPDDNYPEGIYRCTWGTEDFPLEYGVGYTGSGFSGDLIFKEY